MGDILSTKSAMYARGGTYELAAGAEVEVDEPAAWLLGLYPSEYQMGTMLGSARRRFTFPTNSSSRLPSASYAEVRCFKLHFARLSLACVPASRTAGASLARMCIDKSAVTHKMSLVRGRELEDIRPAPCGLLNLVERRVPGEED